MKREKLTLRLERDLIEKAKRVAKERKTSVSGMVAGFFDTAGGYSGLAATPRREAWMNVLFDTNVILDALLDREP